MKLPIENDKIKPSSNASKSEAPLLHFHSKKTTKTRIKKVEKQVFYQYISDEDNLNKAFDILFETILNNEINT